MPLPELPGICGPANRPCKISHVSSYPNKVGIYPSDFLPTQSTIWHAVFASQFSPAQPLFEPGSILPGSVGSVVFPLVGPTLPVFHNFQSHHHIVFARTANRVNVPYTITEQDDLTIDQETGVITIDVGEYIFEVVAVTDDPIDIDTTLSDTEASNIDPNCTEGCSPESKSDREFRKLFELGIPANRFVEIAPNRLGIEYRMDNGSPKSNNILSQKGLGDANSASLQDGSSKRMRINADDSQDSQTKKILKPGSTVYLTYVAVVEHYLRQRVNISWQTIDPGTAEFASTCISLMTSFNIVHYRFYEWDMEPESGNSSDSPVKLSGWRAVESFGADVNFVAPVRVNNQTVIADFLIGAPSNPGIKTTELLPGEISVSQLQSFMQNRDTIPRDSINTNQFLGEFVFHKNFMANSSDAKNSDWFKRNIFSKFSSQFEAKNHVFFNVHPLALRRRDIDKWGIERFLAVELEKDIKSGKETGFPFMDDPTIDDPTGNVVLDTVTSSNTKFEPINPVSSYGGNFEAVCGSIGSFPANPGVAINSYFSFESNIIRERFEEDTRVLVERNFAVDAGPLGPNLITIEGVGSNRTSSSIVTDPSGQIAVASHLNQDSFLSFNIFGTGNTQFSIKKLQFRPDLGAPLLEDNAIPNIDQFEPELGITGMLGDKPGIQPGYVASISSIANSAGFIYHTTDKSRFKELKPDIPDDQIVEIDSPNFKDGVLTISLGNNYHGILRMEYDLRETDVPGDIILRINSGTTNTGTVDGISIAPNSTSIQVSFKWIKGNFIELIGPKVQFAPWNFIYVQSLKTSKVGDFVDNTKSHSKQFAALPIDDRSVDEPMFFQTNIQSITEDKHSNLYIFFNDADNGISVASSNNFGKHWNYHYGVIETIDHIESRNPFVISDFGDNVCYVFFQFMNKILCKVIPFSSFVFKDANLIERFNQDVFTESTEDSVAKESSSIYSETGRILRRVIPAFVAKGDMTDGAFLDKLGLATEDSDFSRNEIREVNGKEVSVRKNIISRSPRTAFPNKDQIDPFFSAYLNRNGDLKLFTMSEVIGEDNPQLQCHFSTDGGQGWYDLWEFISFRYERFRRDPIKLTQFIDRSADGPGDIDNTANDPQERDQEALFGINIHWSRLRKHKKDTGEGELSISSESKTLEVSSPYVFYQTVSDRVFLFYVYEGCLLCKIFNDQIFNVSLGNRGKSSVLNNSINFLKNSIERQTKSYFIDGSLSNESIREEIQGFTKIVDNRTEKMSEGNIVFKYPFTVGSFTEERTIKPQRVCAHEIPSGFVRVVYKHANSVNLKSAIWNGNEWWSEDFIKNANTQPPFVLPDEDNNIIDVVGGFGSEAFEN